MAEDVDGARQVDEARLVGRAPDVEALERRQELDVAFDEIAERAVPVEEYDS